MKAYLFNSENGLYQGETFENDDTIKYVDGITPIPPPDYEHGQVPVFDRRKNEWAVIPVTIARQLLNISTSESTERKV
jgi:hypothetical protein